jgi:hypothetical protein
VTFLTCHDRCACKALLGLEKSTYTTIVIYLLDSEFAEDYIFLHFPAEMMLFLPDIVGARSCSTEVFRLAKEERMVGYNLGLGPVSTGCSGY